MNKDAFLDIVCEQASSDLMEKMAIVSPDREANSIWDYIMPFLQKAFPDIFAGFSQPGRRQSNVQPYRPPSPRRRPRKGFASREDTSNFLQAGAARDREEFAKGEATKEKYKHLWEPYQDQGPTLAAALKNSPSLPKSTRQRVAGSSRSMV